MNSNESSLTPFAFEGHQVRVITDEQGEPWFIAADVCSVLGIGNPRQAMSRLDEDERAVISTDTPGGEQSMTTINESGLFNLVLGSRKPEARRFKRWVTHEVLPAIRRTGRYAIPGTVAALLLIGDAVARVPGVKRGIAMAAPLTCIQENTCLATETLRRALPSTEAPICSLSADRRTSPSAGCRSATGVGNGSSPMPAGRGARPCRIAARQGEIFGL